MSRRYQFFSWLRSLVKMLQQLKKVTLLYCMGDSSNFYFD